MCRRGLLTGVSPVTLEVLWDAQYLSSCQEESGSDEQGEWQLGMLQDPRRLWGKLRKHGSQGQMREALPMGISRHSPFVAVEV